MFGSELGKKHVQAVHFTNLDRIESLLAGEGSPIASHIVPRVDMFFEPYSCLSLDQLIAFESHLEPFTRKSWSHKIAFEYVDELDGTLVIKDPDQGRAVILDRLRKRKIGEMGIARQIVYNWLLGQSIHSTISDELNEKIGNEYLSRQHIKLFLQGSESEVKAYQEKYGLDAHPSIEWKMYTYRCDSIPVQEEYRVFLDALFKKDDPMLIPYNVYGIVSQDHHLRTDKHMVRDIVGGFLCQRGFDSDSSDEAFDMERHGEPIHLWHAQGQFSGTDFVTLVGVNFGYDNGFSSFRIGLGIETVEGLRFSQINRRLLRDFASEKSIGVTFDRWIHHDSYGGFEKRLKEFLDLYYEETFTSMGKVLKKSKARKFTSMSSSKTYLLHTHSTQFKEHSDGLSSGYDKYSDVYGHTRYTHFLAWNELAKTIRTEDLRLSSMAEWIAGMTLWTATKKEKKSAG